MAYDPSRPRTGRLVPLPPKPAPLSGDPYKKYRIPKYKIPDGDRWRSQVARARYTHDRYRSNNLVKAVGRNSGSATVKNLQTPRFNYLMDKAYGSTKGYIIGEYQGKKIMVVSGSRNIPDWLMNAYDLIPSKHRVSHKTSAKLSEIAKRNNVDLVVGHSRAGKLVSHMRGPYKKLSVDGAMVITPSARDRKILNVHQKSNHLKFDDLLALRGRNNYGVKRKSLGQTHYVFRDYKGYKPSGYKPYYNPIYKPNWLTGPGQWAGTLGKQFLFGGIKTNRKRDRIKFESSWN